MESTKAQTNSLKVRWENRGQSGTRGGGLKAKENSSSQNKNVEKGTRQEGLPHQAAESAKIPAQVQEGEQGSPTSSW